MYINIHIYIYINLFIINKYVCLCLALIPSFPTQNSVGLSGRRHVAAADAEAHAVGLGCFGGLGFRV